MHSPSDAHVVGSIATTPPTLPVCHLLFVQGKGIAHLVDNVHKRTDLALAKQRGGEDDLLPLQHLLQRPPPWRDTTGSAVLRALAEVYPRAWLFPGEEGGRRWADDLGRLIEVRCDVEALLLGCADEQHTTAARTRSRNVRLPFSHGAGDLTP